MFGTCWGLFLVKQTLWDGLCMFMWSEESQECQVLSTAWTMMVFTCMALCETLSKSCFADQVAGCQCEDNLKTSPDI